MNASDEFYLKYKEPYQACLLALRYIVMMMDENITQEIRYQIPLFNYKGKKLAILWVSGKKLLFGFVTDKSILPVINGKKPRNRYEMIEIDPNADIPKDMIIARLQQKIKLYDEFK
ncbi:MAG: hypothetical protein ACM3O8_10780 [Methylococcaceae bacterium]